MYIIDFLLYALFIMLFGIAILNIYRRTLHFSTLEIGKNFKICEIISTRVSSSFKKIIFYISIKLIENQYFLIFYKFCDSRTT